MPEFLLGFTVGACVMMLVVEYKLGKRKKPKL